MNRRILTFMLAVMMLIPFLGGSAQSAHLVKIQFPDYVRPGKAEMLKFDADHAGTGTLTLLDQSGQEQFVIHEGLVIHAGSNTLVWNGFSPSMQAPQEGQYTLRLQVAEDLLEHPVRIGQPSPQITQLMLGSAQLVPGEEWGMSVQVNMPGTLAVVFHIAEKMYPIFNEKVAEGTTQITWDGLLEGETPPVGFHTLSVVFVDESGFAANQQQFAQPSALGSKMWVAPMISSTTPNLSYSSKRVSAVKLKA